MLSVVVTSYNDAVIVPELTRRLKAVLQSLDHTFEIIFVDDGSTDGSTLAIEREHSADARVKLIAFSRNFGQPFALRAGIEHATGDTIVIMDGDLQDLPEEIPKIIAPLGKDVDLVYAKRARRKDIWYRKVSSRIVIKTLAFFIRDVSFKKGDEVMLVGVFRAMNRNVADAIKSLPEHTAYIQALIRWVGFKQVVVEVEHGKRFAGTSKYSFLKLARYALDGIFSFSTYPLRIASYLGFFITALSFVAAIGYFIQRVVYGTQLVGFTSLMIAVLFFGGVELMMFGIIGEYMARMYEEVKGRPLYVIKKKML